jgi:hypothetical protein
MAQLQMSEPKAHLEVSNAMSFCEAVHTKSTWACFLWRFLWSQEKLVFLVNAGCEWLILVISGY